MAHRRGPNWHKVMADLHAHYTDAALAAELRKMGVQVGRSTLCELRKGRPSEPRSWSLGDALLELQARHAA
jgi:hypothetical protein